MIKNINLSRISVITVAAFMALALVLSATPQTAHAAIALDATTTAMVGNVITATGNLVSTVQTKINEHAFTPAQSVAISGILGNISNVLVNISSMIGGIVLPNTGEQPAGMVN